MYFIFLGAGKLLCFIISYRSGIAFSFSLGISLGGTAAWMVGSLDWGSHDGHRSGSAVSAAWVSCKYSKHAVFVPSNFFIFFADFSGIWVKTITVDHFVQLLFALIKKFPSKWITAHVFLFCPSFWSFALSFTPASIWTDHVHGQNGRISLHAPLCLFKCGDFSTALWLVGDPWLGILDAEHHDLCGVGCPSMSPGQLRWYSYFIVFFWRQIYTFKGEEHEGIQSSKVFNGQGGNVRIYTFWKLS